MFSSLGNDLRFTARSARRNPLFTAVVVLTLAVGIGANTAMFSVIHAAPFEPLPFKDPDPLVLAQTTFGGVVNPYASAPDYYDYRDQAEGFDTFAAYAGNPGLVTLVGSGQPERANACK